MRDRSTRSSANSRHLTSDSSRVRPCAAVSVSLCLVRTYHVEAGHAKARGSVFDVEEEEDVDQSQRDVEQAPAPGSGADFRLLGDQPEGRREPVETWRSA